MSVTVIIATTGVSELEKSIQSVLDQSYETSCYVVSDGREHFDSSCKVLEKFKRNPKVDICFLPINVGANGFYGHRIYAAFTHLINTDYVMYLDHDNWIDKEHVKTCVELILDKQLDWCYSLREIYNREGVLQCNDDCESLGKYQTYHGVNMIDTNAVFLTRKIAIQLAGLWYNGWNADRIFSNAAMQHFPKFECTGKYSLKYRIGGNTGSVTKEFFENGNKIMNDKYHGDFPWRRKA